MSAHGSLAHKIISQPIGIRWYTRTYVLTVDCRQNSNFRVNKTSSRTENLALRSRDEMSFLGISTFCGASWTTSIPFSFIINVATGKTKTLARTNEIFLWSKSANLVKCLWVLCVKRIFVWRVIRDHYRHGKLVECIISSWAEHKRHFRQHAAHSCHAKLSCGKGVLLAHWRWDSDGLSCCASIYAERPNDGERCERESKYYVYHRFVPLFNAVALWLRIRTSVFACPCPFNGHCALPSHPRSIRDRRPGRGIEFLTVFIASDATKKLHWPEGAWLRTTILVIIIIERRSAATIKHFYCTRVFTTLFSYELRGKFILILFALLSLRCGRLRKFKFYIFFCGASAGDITIPRFRWTAIVPRDWDERFSHEHSTKCKTCAPDARVKSEGALVLIFPFECK